MGGVGVYAVMQIVNQIDHTATDTDLSTVVLGSLYASPVSCSRRVTHWPKPRLPAPNQRRASKTTWTRLTFLSEFARYCVCSFCRKPRKALCLAEPQPAAKAAGAANPTVAFEHADAIEPRHRFPQIAFRGETWDLRHLDAFALRMDPALGFEVDVVVLFTCHCFTHSIKRDVRAPVEIPPEEIYDDNVERRVLSKERYDLSRRFLPGLVKDLGNRTIQYAGEDSLNYFTAEDAGADAPGTYAVFFEVKRDKRRKRRLLLYVQSAYRLESLSHRLAKAGKVRFATLLRKTYQGR